MNKIKFSHNYHKLPEGWDGSKAILIGAIYIQDMDKFKKYLPQLVKVDTLFIGENGLCQCSPLNFKTGILLTFLHCNSSSLFTTIRRYTAEKLEYYEMNGGAIFELMKVKSRRVIKNRIVYRFSGRMKMM